jgi:6-phosphogluconolactonase
VEGQRLSGGGGAGGAGAPGRIGAPVPGGRREVRVVADAEELTRAAAEEVAATLAKAAAGFPSDKQGGSRLATSGRGSDGRQSRHSLLVGAATFVLSGGSTPRSLYRLLADPNAPWRGRIDWPAIHFFWGDERHVPPDHPDSNFRMAREAMLDHVPAPAAHVHRIAGEEPDAARAAERYERELIDLFALRAGGNDGEGGEGAASVAGSGWPRFDLVLLGLGEEGHTASLFPGSPLLARTPPLAGTRPPGWLAAAVWVEKLATWRITLTAAAINHAANVIFLVSGAAKAPALAAVLEGEPQPQLYPAQVVAPIQGRLLWLVDRAAAAQLRSSA